MVDIVMPRLSDSMEEGTVLRWLKGVGDEVAVGEELVEIETDKANMVYESDTAGTVVEILAQEGDTLPVGDPIARVGDASEVVEGSGAGPGPPPEDTHHLQKSRAPMVRMAQRPRSPPLVPPLPPRRQLLLPQPRRPQRRRPSFPSRCWR